MGKTTWVWVVVCVVVALVAFFGGAKYGESKGGAGSLAAAAGAYGQRGTGAGAGGAAGSGARRSFGSGNAPVIGKIISQSGSLFTIQLSSGGSKNVVIGSSTTIAKSTPGAVSDLANGTEVIVNGTTNSTDGTVTATNVQIRPAGSTGMMGGSGMGGGHGQRCVTIHTPAQ